MASIKPSKALVEIQRKIDAHHLAHHKAIQKIVATRDVAKNAVFAERTAALKQRNIVGVFWASVLRAHPDISQELMGPYDDQILNTLVNYSVEYREDGSKKVSMEFKPNDFFEETTLWAEIGCEDPEDSEEADPDDGRDEAPAFTSSGITWKPNRGPEDDNDDAGEDRKVGSKASREADKGLRGPSLFEAFGVMPEHPDDVSDNEEGDDSDDEEREEMAREWSELLDERLEIFKCLVEEAWEDPLAVLAPDAAADSEATA